MRDLREEEEEEEERKEEEEEEEKKRKTATGNKFLAHSKRGCHNRVECFVMQFTCMQDTDIVLCQW